MFWPGIKDAYEKVHGVEDSYIHIKIREEVDTLETAEYLRDVLQDIFDKLAETCQIYVRLPLEIQVDRAFDKDVADHILVGRYSINKDTTATPGYTGSVAVKVTDYDYGRGIEVDKDTLKYTATERYSKGVPRTDWRTVFGTTT